MDIQPPNGPKPEDQNQPSDPPMPPQPAAPITQPPASPAPTPTPTPQVSPQTPSPAPNPDPVQPPQPPNQTSAPQTPQATPTPPPAPQQPSIPVAPQSMPMGNNSPVATNNPGKGLGIASLVIAFIPTFGLIALILGIVAKKKSSNAGQKNGLALAGIILGILNLVGAIVIAVMIGWGTSQLVDKCEELGPGVHIENGVTYDCTALEEF